MGDVQQPTRQERDGERVLDGRRFAAELALPPHNRDMRRLIPDNGMVPVAEG